MPFSWWNFPLQILSPFLSKILLPPSPSCVETQRGLACPSIYIGPLFYWTTIVLDFLFWFLMLVAGWWLLKKMGREKVVGQSGFALIEILIALAVFIIIAAGGVVVWQKKISPTPTPIPIEQTKMPWEDSVCGNGICEPCEAECCNYPCVTDAISGQLMCPPPTCLGYCPQDCQEITPIPSPKQEFTFPTEYSCNADSDCVLKNRPYCCGERLGYYKWCYYKSVEPEIISCKGVGSCPGIARSAKSCVCQNGKCAAIFTETQTGISNLHKPCGPNDQCPTGQKCISYHGIAGPRGPLFKTCEIPCPNGDSDCPKGFICYSVSDGPGEVCFKTPTD